MFYEGINDPIYIFPYTVFSRTCDKGGTSCTNCWGYENLFGEQAKLGPNWTYVRDESLDGKVILYSEASESHWFITPEIYVGEGSSHLHGRNFYTNANPTKIKYISSLEDTEIIKITPVGVLTVTASAGETVTKYEIPVFLETRICACTYKK